MRIARQIGQLSMMLFLMLRVCPAPAMELGAGATLRIDPGTHTAGITRIAADSQGRWLVTASKDKTARVWDLGNGRLLSTIRLPLGIGTDSRLDCVAVSPDGQTIALGGRTDPGADSLALNGGSYSITFHERATGKMKQRIDGLPDIIVHLAFSADGQHLAASLSGRFGMRVFSVNDGALLAEDHDYEGSSHSVQFSKDGRVVTTSDDGFVRLYRFAENRLELLAKLSPQGGKRPRNARFSQDGKRIAVAFSDTPAINVFEGKTLEFLYAPDTRDATKPFLTVAWSHDDSYLFAAGENETKGRKHIRRWSVQRRWFIRADGVGTPQDWPVARDAILDLAPLPGNRIAYGTADPSWGVVEPRRGTHALLYPPAVPDFRGFGDGFKLSADGIMVGIGYEAVGKSQGVFDLGKRTLLPDNATGFPVAPPVIDVDVTDWRNSRSPKINGNPIPLNPREWSRSLAPRPHNTGFVLGTDTRLLAFDYRGQPQWTKQVVGTVWGLQASQDGRWIVAAHGDGTLRWYRSADGAEQLALYLHPDRRRWVLWSPAGYYDASPGAEDLIGWQLDQGRDQVADYYPASRFRDRLYRPDILSSILDTGDERQAVERANPASGRKSQAPPAAQSLPPLVDIVSPPDGTRVSGRSLVLRYATRTPADTPVTGLHLRINGQAISLTEANLFAENEISISIPPRDSEIQLFAENRHGVSSPATVRVTWAGEKLSAKREAGLKPDLYVLAVGVSRHAHTEFGNLRYAARDARDFVSELERQKGKFYADVHTRLLTDVKATRDELVNGLEWLKRVVKPKDVAIVFLAGHGLNDNAGKSYFVPHDAEPFRLSYTGMPQADIRDALGSLAGKAVMFIDIAHAVNDPNRGVASNPDAFANTLSSAENGVVVFAASTGRQLSVENEGWGNGAFTKAVIEGLAGKAEFQRTGRVTHKGLGDYVAERVKQMTKGQQSPAAVVPAGMADFPLAAVRPRN